MRLSRLMGLAVVLVAMAAAMNALAFKTANVTNTFSITVDTTSAAALAISAGTGSGFTSTIGTKGYVDVQFSDKIQPNSDYTFGPIFTITNKNANAVNITNSVTGLANGVTATLVQSDLATSINGSLAKDGAIPVYVKFTVPADFVAGQGGTLNTAQSGTFKITATEP